MTILKEKILLIFHSNILFKGLITLCFYIFEKLKWFRSRYLCITAPEHSSYWFTSWISQLWFKHLFPKEHLSHLLNQVEVQKAPMDYECISIVWCWSQSAAAEKNCFNPSIQGRIIWSSSFMTKITFSFFIKWLKTFKQHLLNKFFWNQIEQQHKEAKL